MVSDNNVILRQSLNKNYTIILMINSDGKIAVSSFKSSENCLKSVIAYRNVKLS